MAVPANPEGRGPRGERRRLTVRPRLRPNQSRRARSRAKCVLPILGSDDSSVKCARTIQFGQMNRPALWDDVRSPRWADRMTEPAIGARSLRVGILQGLDDRVLTRPPNEERFKDHSVMRGRGRGQPFGQLSPRFRHGGQVGGGNGLLGNRLRQNPGVERRRCHGRPPSAQTRTCSGNQKGRRPTRRTGLGNRPAAISRSRVLRGIETAARTSGQPHNSRGTI